MPIKGNGLATLKEFVRRYGRLPTEIDPDYLEMLNMSKYRILALPTIKPAKCANCGSTKNDGRQYVDFGLEVDWYGIVYLCGLCLRDIATEFGLFDELHVDIERLKKENQELNDKLNLLLAFKNEGKDLKDEFLHIFKEVKDYLDGIYSSGDSSTTNSNLSVDIYKESETTDSSEPATTQSEQQPDEAKSRIAKSTSSSGRKDLPSLAELLKRSQ